MRAIVLAAGYATRLYPLTETIAKPLLPVAGEPLVDRIVAKLQVVPGLAGIHVVTNAKFAPLFDEWARARVTEVPLHVHDDGTSTEETRLGAIGDIRFVLAEAAIDREDVIVVAGDNLFDFALGELVRFAAAKDGSAVAVYEHPDRSLLSQYGIVDVDEDDRVTAFLEKPERPPSNLVATATYVFRSDHVALVEDYLAEGNSPDQPGRFVAWLQERRPVYGFRFSGEWIDIGDLGQLLDADNRLRARAGLPERSEYSLS
jgi:glucose-1-phosphate thymidylyltransferase